MQIQTDREQVLETYNIVDEKSHIFYLFIYLFLIKIGDGLNPHKVTFGNRQGNEQFTLGKSQIGNTSHLAKLTSFRKHFNHNHHRQLIQQTCLVHLANSSISHFNFTQGKTGPTKTHKST